MGGGVHDSVIRFAFSSCSTCNNCNPYNTLDGGLHESVVVFAFSHARNATIPIPTVLWAVVCTNVLYSLHFGHVRNAENCKPYNTLGGCVHESVVVFACWTLSKLVQKHHSLTFWPCRLQKCDTRTIGAYAGSCPPK